MHQPGDFQNVLVEDAHGVGVSEHQASGVVTQRGLQALQIHAAVRGGVDVDHLVAAHSGGSRVGAVGGVGDDDLGALLVATGVVVLLDEQDAGELTVCASGRLEGHVVHAGDLAQVALSRVQHLQRTLLGFHRSQRMGVGEAGQSGHLFVDSGVVLHGAGAQGIKTAVDAVDLLDKLRVVAGNIGLAQLRQGRLFRSAQFFGQCHGVHVTGGQDGTTAARNALLKDQFHFASTSSTIAAA